MFVFPLVTSLVLSQGEALATPDHVSVLKDENGQTLQLNGEPYFIRGMNWGYVPIGTNYSYNFWAESEWVIKTALDKEMRLLQDMGVNPIASTMAFHPNG